MDHAMQQDWRPRSDDEMAAALNKSLDALPLLKDKDKLINRAQFFAALGDEIV